MTLTRKKTNQIKPWPMRTIFNFTVSFIIWAYIWWSTNDYEFNFAAVLSVYICNIPMNFFVIFSLLWLNWIIHFSLLIIWNLMEMYNSAINSEYSRWVTRPLFHLVNQVLNLTSLSLAIFSSTRFTSRTYFMIRKNSYYLLMPFNMVPQYFENGYELNSDEINLKPFIYSHSFFPIVYVLNKYIWFESVCVKKLNNLVYIIRTNTIR